MQHLGGFRIFTIYIFFFRFFSPIDCYKILSIDSSLYCAVGPYWLSILYIGIVNMLTQTPHLSYPHNFSPLVAISSFSISVWIYFCFVH